MDKMKKKNQNRANRAFSTLLTLALILCQMCLLSACGKEDVERNKATIEKLLPDGVEASDVADMLESGMSVDEVIDRVEDIKDGKVQPTDKPAETPSPTEKPESTATPTPEPTVPPHVHKYTAESITTQATCNTAGVKTLTCSCGEVKTETVPASGNHNWVEETKITHHEALGHVEQVQVGTTDSYTIYECAVCGYQDTSPLSDHRASYVGVDRTHATARTIAYDYPEEPIFESKWVVDQEAYDSEDIVGYKCSICGTTK